MKYLILIQSNERSRAIWETLTDDERREFGRGHLRLKDKLLASGELVVSEALTDPALARSVSRRDGHTLVSDGPFAEAKEHLAGFILVNCDSEERAHEIAADVPDAQWGEVVVRPVFDLRAVDL